VLVPTGKKEGKGPPQDQSPQGLAVKVQPTQRTVHDILGGHTRAEDRYPPGQLPGQAKELGGDPETAWYKLCSNKEPSLLDIRENVKCRSQDRKIQKICFS